MIIKTEKDRTVSVTRGWFRKTTRRYFGSGTVWRNTEDGKRAPLWLEVAISDHVTLEELRDVHVQD